ncbi:MAG: hypothetical protein KIT20_05295 [Alphaproteobacteria bacterium]|nr:hypothetical protein [Alphaproteobacteria bacterium]
MNNASTDHGSILPPNAAALVVDASGDITLLLPDYPAAAEVPRIVQLLAAVMLRSRDEEWVEEMLDILADVPRS